MCFSANDYVGVVVFLCTLQGLFFISEATEVYYHGFYGLSFSTSWCSVGVFLCFICFSFT